VPVSILKAASRVGGLVGGAVGREEELVGFVFGIAGISEGCRVHWSHMLAVRPELRNEGLGLRLKAWQRERCLEMGVQRMYWTFDPLESRNGWLNIGRLGVVVREYVADMYGASDSPLHRGVGTDRFVALWTLDGWRARRRLEGRAERPTWEDVRDLPRAFPVTGGPAPRPVPVATPDRDEAGGVLVPIPADIQAIRTSDPELAVAWRTATRAALLPRLAKGWEVCELIRTTEPLSYYLLRPRSGD
jgi:predicted GNAT superfamily acetyltransferase